MLPQMMSALKGGLDGLAFVCIIYLPVHAFWHRPSFLLCFESIINKLSNFSCKLP